MKREVCADIVLSAFMCVSLDVFTRAAREASHASVWLIVEKRLEECANGRNRGRRDMIRSEMKRRRSVIK